MNIQYKLLVILFGIICDISNFKCTINIKFLNDNNEIIAFQTKIISLSTKYHDLEMVRATYHFRWELSIKPLPLTGEV